MSRTLHRPMFRRGGSTGEGITSGLRQGYEDGMEVTDVRSFIGEPPELPRSSADADFWLNFGTSMLAAPGGRPILQTIGSAGQEPLAQYQKQKHQEEILKYKHAQGERQFQLELYKAMTDEDKIALQKEIEYLMKEHGLSKEEALARAMREYRLQMHPADKERLETTEEKEQLDSEIKSIISGLSKEGSYVSYPQAAKINTFYKQADDQGWRYESDAPFIDYPALETEWRDAGKEKDNWIDPDSGNIAISPKQQSTYTEGFYYVDMFTGDVYQVGPKSLELIKIDLSEIKIN